MNKTLSAASLALALSAAMGIAAAPAIAASHGGAMKAETEKCFGVALKGKNDCKAGAGTSCAGTSKTDHQGNAWSMVPKGSCEKTASKTSPTGKGQLGVQGKEGLIDVPGTEPAMGILPLAATPRRSDPAPARSLPPRAGIGLKPEHFRALLQTRPDLGFVEIHAENYMVAGGPFHHWLTRIREHYALSVHGVGLSIGGEEPLDEAHLDRLARCSTATSRSPFPSTWPGPATAAISTTTCCRWPTTRATLARVCAHIDRVQERSSAACCWRTRPPTSSSPPRRWTRPISSARSCARSGCGLLLDVNNVHVSCTNHGRDARDTIRRLPLDAVGQIHLAGFAVEMSTALAHRC
jgi:uncharacterized protein (UPF0276 family)/uncharacterized membrane protein